MQWLLLIGDPTALTENDQKRLGLTAVANTNRAPVGNRNEKPLETF